MSEQKSAIDALKAMLSQQVDKPVALTNFTPGKSVAKYVGGINVDWDPKDHPRDPNNGQFVETPGGFIFGKAKSAEFPLGDSKKSLNLQPGDIAFKTPTGNVVVSHADDSYTLHHADGKVSEIPGGSSNVAVTDMAQSGKLQKIGENPAVQVQADNIDEAKQKLANPGDYDAEKADLPKAPPAPPKEEAEKFPDNTSKGAQFLGEKEKIKDVTPDVKVSEKQAKEAEKKSSDAKNVENENKSVADLKQASDAPGPKSGDDIFDKGYFGENQHPGPAFKNGKTQYTAKQIKDYQDEHAGVVLGKDKNGKDITSGSWVDVEGKPLLIHASPYGGVTAYRWVSTKQQASNLPKENLLSVNDFPDVESIDDPTGKPYGVETPDAPEGDSSPSLKHGSIMSQAVTGAIPNSAVKHKLFVESADKEKTSLSNGFVSGDWVDIDGKPWQVHASPNEGNIAMAKWVSTKQKKSNNTYDFPISVLETAVKIDDPTGTDYKPVNKIDAAEKVQQEEEPDGLLPATPLMKVLEEFQPKEAPLPDWEKEVLGEDAAQQPEAPNPLNYVYDPEEPLADWEKELLGYPLNEPEDLSADQAINDMAQAYKNSIKESGNVDLVADIASGKMSLSETFQKAAQKTISDLHSEGTLGDGWMEKAGLDVPKPEVEDGQKKLSDSDVWFVHNDGKLMTTYYKNADGSWYAYFEDGGTADTLTEEEVQGDFDLPSSGANGTTSSIEWTTSSEFSEKIADPEPVPAQKLTDSTEWDVTTKNGDPIGTYYKNADGSWKFLSAQSDYSQEDMDSTLVQEDFDDSNLTGKHDNLWFPVKKSEAVEQTPVIEADTSPNVFVHPVSGVTMELEDGDEVYKAKLTENAYIVKKANSDTPYHYFNYAGKAYKPKAEQKSFDKNYEKVAAWPGKKDGKSAAEPEAAASDDVTDLELTEDLLNVAVPGDKITMDDLTTVKKEDGNWYTLKPNGEEDGGFLYDDDYKEYLAKGDFGTFTPFSTQAAEVSEQDTAVQMDSAPEGEVLTYTAKTSTFGSSNQYSMVKDKKSKTGWTWTGDHSQSGNDVPNALLTNIKQNPGNYDPVFSSQADNSHASVDSDDSHSEVDVQETTVSVADQVENAVAGDVVVAHTSPGKDWTYTKKADGTWITQSPSGSSTDDVPHSIMVSMVTEAFVPWEWKGADYKPVFKEDESEAPWGGKEAVGDVPTPAAKATPIPKKAASPDADSYTIGAKSIDLKPGEFIAFFPNNQGGAYVHYTPKKNKYDYHDVYDSTGASKYMNSVANKSAAQIKKLVKDNDGASIVAEKKVAKKAKNDYSSYESGADLSQYSEMDESTASYYAASAYVNNLAKPVPLSYYGSISYTDVLDYGKPWSSLTNDERLTTIASYKDIAGNGHATMAALESSITDKSDKLAVTKTKNAFDLIYRIAEFAEEILNSDTEWTTEDFNSELAVILPKAQKPGVSMGPWLKTWFPISEFADPLEKALQSYEFKKGLKGLGFDPDSASFSELDTYAKGKGFQFLAAMPPELHKSWVLNDLGDPTITGADKNILTAEANKAKVKIGVAEVIASITKNSNSAPTLVKVPHSVKGAALKSQMKNQYSWTAEDGSDITVTNIGSDEWDISNSKGSSLTMTDAVVQALVNNSLVNGATNLSESDEYAYASGDIQQQVQKFVKQFNSQATSLGDLSAEEAYEALSSSVVNAGVLKNFVTGTGAKRYLAMHISGDEVGKYHMAANYLPADDEWMKNHLGSPNGTSGKAAHAAFANWIQAQTWGPTYKSGNTSYINDPNFAQFLSDTYGPTLTQAGWHKYHPPTLLDNAPDTSVITTPDGKVLAVKPANISDEAWALVTNATSESDFAPLFAGDPVEFMDVTDLDVALSKTSKVVNSGLIPPLLGGVPTHLKKLVFWATKQSDSSELQSGIINAVAVKAKTGEFLDDQTPVWVAPDGGKFPISPGAKVYEYGGMYYVTGPPNPDGSESNGYQFSKGNTPQQVSSYTMLSIVKDPDYTNVFTMPNPVTWMSAKKENPDFNESIWNFVEQQETDPKDISTALGSGSVLTAYLKNHSKIQEWPNLYAQHKSLPEHVRNLIANSLHSLQNGTEGQRAILDVLEYKASKGHYASMQSKGLYEPTAPWLPHLSLGQTSSDAVLSKWKPEAKSAYLKSFGLTDEGQIPAHLDSLINPPTFYVSKVLPKWEDLQLTHTGKSLGGMHTKKHWVDQDGNEWMTKAFNSDPNARARVDAEIAGIKIGALYGFKVPEAEQLQLVPGQSDYAYLQHLKPGPGDFMSKGVGDLSTKQLQQAMEEHLLDWIISNHDSHAGNLRFDNNGNVFGIDKGQAFKHFPQDKLAVGYLPPENGAAVWYDQFYNALMSGQISKEKADEVTKHVLRRAQQISKDKDEEFRAHLEYAFKNRGNTNAEIQKAAAEKGINPLLYKGGYETKQEFIDALVERKHNAFDDFVSFYKNLYKKSPYDFDIDTENLVPPKLDDHTHISVSQDYADDVKKAGLHGKAMMFASDDLEDSHILMSTAVGSNGKVMLTGEAKIRKDGDTILSNWLKQHTIESTIGYQSQSFVEDIEEEDDDPDPSAMPQNYQWFSALVAGSKTVSSHNKAGDKQYNQSTLEQMENVKQQMSMANAQITDWEVKNPDKPFVGVIPSASGLNKVVAELQTMEQHEAFKSMLEVYNGYYDKVIAAKGTTEKISPHFQQFTYTPSKAALDALKAAKDAEKGSDADAYAITTPQGYTAVWEQQSDGMWKMKSTTAPNADVESMEKQTKAQIDKWLNTSGNTWKAVKAAEEAAEPEEAVEQDVKVGTKVLHVKYMPSSSPNGSIDFDSGELKLKSGVSNKFQTGHMYQIDFGNTIIEYRPWDSSANVAVAQKGLLRFYKKDWNGDADSIDEIFDVLRQMGLSLDPADEESMETFYWNHLTQIMKNRKGGNQGKWAQVHTALSKSFGDNPNMSSAETLQAYRDAWALAIGEDKVKDADWMPKFTRLRPHAMSADDQEFSTGRPFWTRPDYTVADLKKYVKQFPVSSLSNGGDALKMALSGGAISTEERARFYGSVANSGMSSDADQGHGSSAVIYMRQNMGSDSDDYSVMYHPRVLLRSHNYSFHGDMYGEISNQASYAPWDVSEAASISGGSNETMVKNACSILDDIVMLKFNSEEDRAKAIKHYKDLGVNKLHGIPIEEVFVTYMTYSAMKTRMEEIWKKMEEAAAQ